MYLTETQRITAMLAASAPMQLAEIIAEEIKEFKASEGYKIMAEADQYYRNRSSVQAKVNDVADRSNTKIEHSILKKLITQKVNYLLASPFSVDSDNKGYAEALNKLFDDVYRGKLQGLARNAVRYGIGYLQPYFDKAGKLAFMKLPPLEVIPMWADNEHSEMAGFIRFYPETVYAVKVKKIITRVEFWTADGVQYFIANDGGGVKFEPDLERGIRADHFTVNNAAKNWIVPPIIWARYNEEEYPLQYWIKDLIDDINWQTSVTSDVLRDVAKFIFILKGYGGENLAEFVRDLKKTLAIKVDRDGSVDKLQVDINIEAVMALLEKQRRDVYDYGAGVDTKDPELGTASGVAINFRYMDLDADCRALGLEIKGALQRARIFLDGYMEAVGLGSFAGASLDIIFNTDMPVNETDVITNVKSSDGIISRKTQLDNHPWVTDVEEELAQIKTEAKEAAAKLQEQVASMYPTGDPNDPANKGLQGGKTPPIGG